MSQNGFWGDDLEIQAMSEIYKCPVEIFAYSDKPMKTFHESVGSSTPMRLSYHGRSHYNSVVEKDRHYPLLLTAPGDHEAKLLADVKNICMG